jgi:hypothetical protein
MNIPITPHHQRKLKTMITPHHEREVNTLITLVGANSTTKPSVTRRLLCTIK